MIHQCRGRSVGQCNGAMCLLRNRSSHIGQRHTRMFSWAIIILGALSAFSAWVALGKTQPSPAQFMDAHQTTALHAAKHATLRRTAASTGTPVCDVTCQTQQRDSLLLLYNSTGGGTTWHATWSSGDQPDYCLWTGVTCCATDGTSQGSCPVAGAVSSLRLDYMGLSGTLPSGVFPSLAASLSLLSLLDNVLSGNFPVDVSSLTLLAYLGASSNELQGPISSQLLDLTRLNVLDLSENVLTGTVPDGVSRLSLLESLNLGWNCLVSCPCLSRCSCMRVTFLTALLLYFIMVMMMGWCVRGGAPDILLL